MERLFHNIVLASQTVTAVNVGSATSAIPFSFTSGFTTTITPTVAGSSATEFIDVGFVNNSIEVESLTFDYVINASGSSAVLGFAVRVLLVEDCQAQGPSAFVNPSTATALSPACILGTSVLTATMLLGGQGRPSPRFKLLKDVLHNTHTTQKSVAGTITVPIGRQVLNFFPGNVLFDRDYLVAVIAESDDAVNAAQFNAQMRIGYRNRS